MKVYLGDCLEIMPSLPDKSIEKEPKYYDIILKRLEHSATHCAK